MSEITRTQFAVYAAMVVAVVLIGSRALHAPGPGSAAAAGGSTPAQSGRSPQSAPPADGASGGVQVSRAGGGPALVHVAGAVRHPGVYRLPDGARVQDAVRRAGGRAPGGDVDAINLAARVADGQQIVVPGRVSGRAGAMGSSGAGAGAPAGGAATASGGPGVAAAPVNLNTATAEELDTLDGVGPATAQKIIAFRTEHGGFRSVDDLTQIPGIGPKKLAALRDRVQV